MILIIMFLICFIAVDFPTDAALGRAGEVLTRDPLLLRLLLPERPPITPRFREGEVGDKGDAGDTGDAGDAGDDESLSASSIILHLSLSSEILCLI